MRHWLLGLSLALGLIATLAHAVPLQPGQQYQGGTELEIQAAGLALVVPENWVAVLPPGGSMLVMTPDDQSYVLALAEPATMDEARAFLSNPLPLGNGISLQPRAAPAQDGEDLVVPYEVSGGDEPYEGSGRARRLSNGIVVGVFALARSGGLEPIEGVADQVLANVTVMSSQPQSAEGGGGGSASGDDWHSYLMGRHLVRFFTGSGYNEEQHIYLCSDGHFRKTFGSGGHTSYGEGWSSGATASNDGGRWHATGTGNVGALILQYGDGSRSEIQLEYKDDKVYLDGTQWLRDPENSYCG